MTDIIWPASLPQAPLLANASIKHGSTLIRTGMDGGVAKVRRKQSKGISLISVSVILKNDDMREIFNTFISDSIAGGVKAFKYPKKCYLSGETPEYYDVRLVPESEDILYTEKPITNKITQVDLVLEVLP